tara:strand:- start:6517 stop:7191 length:675 start_codon:yes stop_codon:yes gene_type:complete
MTRVLITALFTVLSITIYAQKKPKVNYVALGDSYTICEGINTKDCWPNILTNNLTKQGTLIELTANPSKTGYTSQDLIDYELPVLARSNANFVTILIGVNDWVQQIDEEVFESNLIYIVETVIEKVGSSNRVLLLTIPDFSATPEGARYGSGRDISKGIAHFNSIILKTADYFDIKTVDLYPTSQKMKGNASLIAADELHPSAKEYVLWEKLIYEEVIKLLEVK